MSKLIIKKIIVGITLGGQANTSYWLKHVADYRFF